jgi:hypothetical protein
MSLLAATISYEAFKTPTHATGCWCKIIAVLRPARVPETLICVGASGGGWRALACQWSRSRPTAALLSSLPAWTCCYRPHPS